MTGSKRVSLSAVGVSSVMFSSVSRGAECCVSMAVVWGGMWGCVVIGCC